MERLPALLQRKRAIAARYRERLQHHDVEFQARPAAVESGEWLFTLLLPDQVDRDAVMARLGECGIESRPTFYCAHHMPMYETRYALPTSEAISRRGISLPSHPLLSDDDVDEVCNQLIGAIGQCTVGQEARVRFA